MKWPLYCPILNMLEIFITSIYRTGQLLLQREINVKTDFFLVPPQKLYTFSKHFAKFLML